MMVSLSCSSTSKTFEKVRDATLTIQNATTVEVSYNQFGVLLQNLAAEIQNVKDKAKSKKAQKTLLVYDHILESYEHSYAAWKLHIDFNGGDPEYLTTTGAGIKRSSLIQSYWTQAAEEFKALDEKRKVK